MTENAGMEMRKNRKGLAKRILDSKFYDVQPESQDVVFITVEDDSIPQEQLFMYSLSSFSKVNIPIFFLPPKI